MAIGVKKLFSLISIAFLLLFLLVLWWIASLYYPQYQASQEHAQKIVTELTAESIVNIQALAESQEKFVCLMEPGSSSVATRNAYVKAMVNNANFKPTEEYGHTFIFINPNTQTIRPYFISRTAVVDKQKYRLNFSLQAENCYSLENHLFLYNANDSETDLLLKFPECY